MGYNHQRRNVKTLTRTMNHLGLNNEAFAKAIGISPSAVSKWLKTGECPIWTDLSCECLLRRTRSFEAEKKKLFIVAVPPAQETVVLTFLKALEISLKEIEP